jgi:hypothetical protein
MKEKSTVRYLGYRTLPDGGRGFDFAFALIGGDTTLITIEAPVDLFKGPNRIAIQEGAGICYETLKCRVEANSDGPPARFSLTSADVKQHRKITKPSGSWR